MRSNMQKTSLTKNDVVEAFGGPTKTARALVSSRQWIYLWPDRGPLPQEVQDRVAGAALRLGKNDLVAKFKRAA